jgi:hypothetical protein
MRVRERRPEQRIPGTGERPEGGETGLSKAGLKGEQEGSKGAERFVRSIKESSLERMILFGRTRPGSP